MEKDFSKWILMEFNWGEISYNINTGNYDKQDLIVTFHNAYIYYEKKINSYYEKYRELPYAYLSDLLFEFRKHFCKTGRVKEVIYFDDMIEILIEVNGNEKIRQFVKHKEKLHEENINEIIETIIEKDSQIEFYKKLNNGFKINQKKQNDKLIKKNIFQRIFKLTNRK